VAELVAISKLARQLFNAKRESLGDRHHGLRPVQSSLPSDRPIQQRVDSQFDGERLTLVFVGE
jgi:hypothetical protein